MADTTASSAKPAYDAQGREVFTVHPEILSGGAPYRKVPEPSATEGARSAARAARRPRPADANS
ncbi:MAG TPA: hypothetical protein VF635_12620 [Propionibacteriaceae bacterium]